MNQGFYHPDRGYWETLAAPTDEHTQSYPEGYESVPLRPSPQHEWSNGAWEFVDDTATRLAQWRDTASLTRTEFCLAIVSEGLLPAAEAIEAAKGGWPATFQAVLSEQTADVQTQAQITWAGASVVHRNHAFLALVQAAAGVSDAQLDTIFGWTGE